MQPARRFLGSAGAAAARRNPAAFTCRGCLTRNTSLTPPPQQQRRAFSHSTPRSAAPAGPSRSGIAPLTSRKLISISGPDAAKYLQGVITANVFTGTSGPDHHARTDPGYYAVFLTAQGRLLHDVFVYPDLRDPTKPAGESFLLEVDAAEAARLHSHIRRYKLRAKFSLRVLDPEEGSVWHAWDDTSSSSSSSLSLPPTTTNLITSPDTRAPNLGFRLLTLNSPTPPPLINLPLVPEESYRLRRYLHGIPEGQSELLRDQALPQESNTDLMGGIDFRKGCYVGQELTIRTEHRGVVRKRVLPCLLYPEDGDGGAVPEGLEYRPTIGGGNGGGEVTAEMVPAEASIGRVGKKGRSAGKWLRGVGNVGLALCRLEIMTDVVLPGETGGTGFDKGNEFVVGLGGGEGEGEAGKKVKIKAFVPPWLREGLAAKEGH